MITALVVVELPTTRLVMLATVARSDEKNPLVVVLFVVTALVVVELPITALVMFARVAMSDEMNELVEVLFVDTRLVAVALVILAFAEKSVFTVPTVVDDVLSTVCPDTVSAVADAVARVD